ncbi:hypothetical protein CGA22_08845 [Pseudomonas sp. PSB18]|nr:hypothetical protein [Pseudomonas sp. PSB18]
MRPTALSKTKWAADDDQRGPENAILTDEQYKELPRPNSVERGRGWEQSLLATQATRFLKDRIGFIADKPCSHNPLATGFQNPYSVFALAVV